MKITIMDVPDGEEDEIIVRCRHIDKQLLKLIYAVKAGQDKILALQGNEYIQISPEKIYYFEAVDNKVFLYLAKVKSLSPAFNGRFEALMQNGEKVMISRQYVPILKEKLGL